MAFLQYWNMWKYLKLSKIVRQQKCPIKHKKRKYLKWFWPVTEGITLVIWKKIIKYYIKDLIFKTFKKKTFKKF